MNKRSFMPVYIATCMLSSIVFIFMILIKLAGSSISWFWVFAPLWMPSCVLAFILLIALVAAIIKEKIIDKHYITRNLDEYF